MALVSIYDGTTFTLKEADLIGKKIGEYLMTPKRDVPCSGGLKWWICWFPAGRNESLTGHVSVYVMVNQPVKAQLCFSVEDSAIMQTALHHFQPPLNGRGWGRFASNEQLGPLFRDGKLNIRCHVRFDDVPDRTTHPVPPFFELCSHAPTDFKLEVGSIALMVHRQFLSLISPVFHSALILKPKSNKMKVTGFAYDVVRAAMDYCYGRGLQVLSIDGYIGMLRFADKYKLTAVTAEVERFLTSNLSVESVCQLLHYAHGSSKKSLLDTCVQFFKDHRGEVMDDFVKLPTVAVVDILKTAFDLKTDFDVLRHAHANGYDSIIEALEQHCIPRITLEDFCSVTSYSWEFKREDLKKACAAFLNGNTNEVMQLPAFFALSQETIGGVMKLGFDSKVQSS